MASAEVRNVIDLSRPFVEAMHANHPDVNWQQFGGATAIALLDEATQIVPEEESVYAPAGLFLPSLRNASQPKSMRDYDFMVLTTNEAAAEQIYRIAEDKIGPALNISGFALHKLEEITRLAQHPPAAKEQRGKRFALADRYVVEDERGVTEARKAVFPFAASMDLATLDTWQLFIGNRKTPVPVPHPGAMILNYLTRSASGLRPKDQPKVGEIVRQTFKKTKHKDDHQSVEAWLHDGPGATQLDLARVLHTLREPARNPQTLTLGGRLTLKPYELAQLEYRPEFMIPHSPVEDRHQALAIAHRKARLMHLFERHPLLVALWQNYLEPHFERTIKNT